MKHTLKIAIAGSAGRMGRQLVHAAITQKHIITGGSEVVGSQALGQDLGLLAGLAPLDVQAVSNIADAARGAEIWLDFTQPSATIAALEKLPELGVKAAIIGTTGFSETENAQISEAAHHLTIVKAGNFSVGINLLQALVRQAAERLGTEWDIEILETHHRHKRDAPSGTALMLGDAAAQGRGASLNALRAPPYDGPDATRSKGKIGFSVRRSGGVIGDHTVSFGSEYEALSLSHTALDRSVFAQGAITAAEWAVTQAPGLYDMNDVLGFS